MLIFCQATITSRSGQCSVSPGSPAHSHCRGWEIVTLLQRGQCCMCCLLHELLRRHYNFCQHVIFCCMCCRLSGQNCSNIQPEMNVACSCSRQADGRTVQCCSLRVSCSSRAAADTPQSVSLTPALTHLTQWLTGSAELRKMRKLIQQYFSIFLFFYRIKLN